MIACRTSTDDCKRASVSSRAVPAQASVPNRPMKPINKTDISFFHVIIPFRIYETKRRELQMG